MSRQFTSGFEAQALDTFAHYGLDGAPLSGSGGNAPTITTATKRTGAAAGSCTSGVSGGFSLFRWTVDFDSNDHWIYARAYVQFSGSVANNTAVAGFSVPSSPFSAVGAQVAGSRLVLWDYHANAQLGAGQSVVLGTGVWYRVEIGIMIPAAAGNGSAMLYLDGTLIQSSTALTLPDQQAPTYFNAGIMSSSAASTVLVDDVAINSDSGGSGYQNSWPGAGSCVLLLPTADSANTGFAPGHVGDSLFNCVNQTPPKGTASTDTTTVNSKIKDSTSNTTDNYRATLQTYTAAGVPAGQTVSVVALTYTYGSNGGVARSIGVSGVSNPVISEGTHNTSATNAGTWPTGWNQAGGDQTVENPSITQGTAPVVQFRKNTATTDAVMSCFLGLYAEYGADDQISVTN